MSLLLGVLIALQSASEVRQIVSFGFLPGRTAEAIQIFRDEAPSFSPMVSTSSAFWGSRASGIGSVTRKTLRGAPFGMEVEEWIVESREVILAPVRELFVR